MKAQLNLFASGFSFAFAVHAIINNSLDAFSIQLLIALINLAWYLFRNYDLLEFMEKWYDKRGNR